MFEKVCWFTEKLTHVEPKAKTLLTVSEASKSLDVNQTRIRLSGWLAHVLLRWLLGVQEIKRL